MSMDPMQGSQPPQQPYAPSYPPPPAYPEQPGYGQYPPQQGYPSAYGQPMPPQQPYGYPANAYAPPMAPATSGMAIASLVCSFFIPLVGVILGHIALSQIKNSNGQLGGRGLAIAGLVIGYVSIALAVIVIAFIIIVTAAASTQSVYPTNFIGIFTA